MTGFLLDTNVISELTKDDPDSRVVRFLDDQGDLWLSSVVVYEMEYGLATLPQGRRLARLRALHADILAAFDDRLLSLDLSGARWAAELQAQARHAGRTVDVGDALIAGTAKAHALAIATRNIRDFQGMDIHIVNPWDYP
ncbi:MAG: type II toxin-antitoxin system VapC family toxin [Chloroflexota bacterium]|nr:type II toxin-antitoxin system VapC family toxin [Chloroflexota bacterium]MDE2920968.1 type II toxin-antitoxin system VapC family toxin [Chloroflexota bacterium]